MAEAEIAHTNQSTRTLLLVVMLASGGAELAAVLAAVVGSDPSFIS